MKRRFINVLIISFLILISSSSLLAQTSNPPALGNTNDLVPLDGGISLLLAAGVAYGARKAYNKSHEEK